MKDLKALSENLEHFKKLIDLFDVSHMGLWEMGSDDSVVFYNEKFYENYDIPTKGSTLENWINLVHPDDKKLFLDGVDEHTTTGVESFKSEYRVINKQGETVWIEAQGVASFDDKGQMQFMVGSHSDITIKKEYQDRLYQEAYIDPITGLRNKKRLLRQIKHDITYKRSSKLFIIQFVQLPGLIQIYGQDFMNNLIKLGGQIIVNAIPDLATPYRLDTAFFGFIMRTPISHEDLSKMMDSIKAQLKTLISNAGISNVVEYRCSYTEYPISKEVLSAEDVLNRGILLLYDSSHSNQIAYYSAKANHKILKAQALLTGIPNAIESNEFYPVYQPIVSADGLSLVGFEALCRWHSPKWGDIYPDEFISEAEKSSSIVKIGVFMMKRACQFIKRYNQQHGTDLTVSVNVSVKELLHNGYFLKLIDLLEDMDMDPKNLVIEITESIMLDNDPDLIDQLNLLKTMGIGIALDDFGTGYASLNTMIDIPITEVKIDREVMLRLNSKSMIRAFIASLVDLCHQYNVCIVAEGIENLTMVELAKELNIDYLQGYLYAKPLPEEEAMDFQL